MHIFTEAYLSLDEMQRKINIPSLVFVKYILLAKKIRNILFNVLLQKLTINTKKNLDNLFENCYSLQIYLFSL